MPGRRRRVEACLGVAEAMSLMGLRREDRAPPWPGAERRKARDRRGRGAVARWLVLLEPREALRGVVRALGRRVLEDHVGEATVW